MNKRQKEVQQVFLDEEKKTLEELEKAYQTALDDINLKLEALLARQDADLEHVIYQIEYQKALKTQVQSILEQLQTAEFETLSKYLAGSYTNGFVGTMYDMAGQGIPLIMPIDQKQVIAAIQNETKLTASLYTELGYDIKKLQKTISSEISRGISTGLTYGDIARNLKNSSKIPLNRAMTIARTESHRIQCSATMDAQYKAREKGADVLKMWNSSLDGLTRPTHRQLDGQIRELDEDFSSGTKKAKYPGAFGDPAEDCNCRCALLQRARWGLDDVELEVLKERASYYGLDKTKGFEDYKKKYLKAAESERVRQDAQRINPKKYKEGLDKAKELEMLKADMPKEKLADTLKNNGKSSKITIYRSVGASGKNYSVKLPDSKQHTKLTEGQIIEGKTFAGKGTDIEIRDRFRLESTYKIPAEEWEKVSGKGKIVLEGKSVMAELHWYQANGEIYEMKVKRYLDDES